ncbi:unnamed protein product [Acanthoscelides obtectus]|uniref:Uncharacterized protein n=1 Tax=Acanthoscelides obtectus TaxID=200917 RepID=A0A9P0Q7J7_ACAOB|nr:unnamed protein product [Acanthoscelides obtectus]CAK1675884.1 hypothetical protein AOBTE_LOCUS30465 [Acanthoscelides obtectus]
MYLTLTKSSIATATTAKLPQTTAGAPSAIIIRPEGPKFEETANSSPELSRPRPIALEARRHLHRKPVTEAHASVRRRPPRGLFRRPPSLYRVTFVNNATLSWNYY